jgi:hypothetical protein
MSTCPESSAANTLAEAARLHELGVIGLVTGGLQQHARERLTRRARIRVADLLAFDVLDRFDRRIGLDGPYELRDGQHVVAHDFQIGTGEDRRYDDAGIHFAVRYAAASQHVAQRRAAARRRDQSRDVEALVLEVTLHERDAERHAVR